MLFKEDIGRVRGRYGMISISELQAFKTETERYIDDLKSYKETSIKDLSRIQHELNFITNQHQETLPTRWYNQTIY